MAKGSPADVIDAYRRRQKRRFRFTFADISTGLFLLCILAASVYISLSGGVNLPTLMDLKTNTPTYTPSITPTASPTATISPVPSQTPNTENLCNCSSPVFIVVTATFAPTNSPLAVASETATSIPLPTLTIPPSDTAMPTATPVLYTVQRNDTLGAIALRFGVSVESIQAINNMDTTFIYVGQVLQIPSQ